MIPAYVSIPKIGPDGNIVRNPDGSAQQAIGINEIRDHIRPFHIPSVPRRVTLAPGATEELKFVVDSQGHFEWSHIVDSQQDPNTGILIEFFDPGTQYKLQARPILLSTIAGSGLRPYRLPEPYFFDVGDAERVLTAVIRNPFGSPQTCEISLFGTRYYIRENVPDVSAAMRQKFGPSWRVNTYFLIPREINSNGLPPTIPGLGSQTFTFDADHDCDSDLFKISAAEDQFFTITLREKDTGRTLMNNPVVFTGHAGNGNFPYYFADTYLLERSKQLIAEVVNLSASTNRVWLTIAGRKLKYVGGK